MDFYFAEPHCIVEYTWNKPMVEILVLQLYHIDPVHIAADRCGNTAYLQLVDYWGCTYWYQVDNYIPCKTQGVDSQDMELGELKMLERFEQSVEPQEICCNCFHSLEGTTDWKERVGQHQIPLEAVHHLKN